MGGREAPLRVLPLHAHKSAQLRSLSEYLLMYSLHTEHLYTYTELEYET